MSYARWSTRTPKGLSHVYVYSDIHDRDGEIRCCSCSLPFESLMKGDCGGIYEHPTSPFIARGPKEMVAHLLEHRAVGHNVPERALKRLRAEARGWKPPKYPIHLAYTLYVATDGPDKGKTKKLSFGARPRCGYHYNAHFRKMLRIKKSEKGHAHHRDQLTKNPKAVTCRECRRLMTKKTNRKKAP